MPKKHIPLDRISPIKATEKRMNSRKFIVFGILSFVAYELIFFKLFWQFFVVESMIYVMLFFIFFQFLYLELRKLPIKYLIIFMLVATVLQWIIIWYENILLICSMISIHIGVVYLAWFLQGESHDKLTFSSRWYFNVGGYIFTVCITLAYSLFILWYYAKFPFTCQDLSAASSRVINIFTNPVTAGVEKIKIDTTALFNTKVKDIAVIGQNISLQSKQSTYMTFIQKFDMYKKNLIDQTLKDNTAVNMWICDYILGQMNKIYENPAFKASVILLMFLLLYGFVRIVLRVMTWIALIIFKILFRFGAYHIHIVLKESEDLE